MSASARREPKPAGAAIAAASSGLRIAARGSRSRSGVPKRGSRLLGIPRRQCDRCATQARWPAFAACSMLKRRYRRRGLRCEAGAQNATTQPSPRSPGSRVATTRDSAPDRSAQRDWRSIARWKSALGCAGSPRHGSHTRAVPAMTQPTGHDPPALRRLWRAHVRDARSGTRRQPAREEATRP